MMADYKFASLVFIRQLFICRLPGDHLTALFEYNI